MGIKNMRAICPNCGGKINTQPRNILGAIAIAANGPLVQTGKRCQHCGVALTGKVTVQNYAVVDQAAGPSGEAASVPPLHEDRATYLARINARPASVSSTERCHARGGGRQCARTVGHTDAHDFSKKGAKRWTAE